jgi:hypothetical protein
MPTDDDPKAQTNGHTDAQVKKPPRPTLERRAFVNGLFNEMREQVARYAGLSAHMAELQARIMIVERNLQLTRDHLQAVLSETDEEVPKDWQKILKSIRFVGARLGDACMEILREGSPLTTQEIVDGLNLGQFRFRTGTPLREVNAALLRQSNIKRENDRWIYTAPDIEPTPRGGPKRKLPFRPGRTDEMVDEESG